VREAFLRASALPSGWSACRTIGRRRAVIAWAELERDGVCEVVGMIARGASLVRGDRLSGFAGYAPGPGCEPQLEPPAVPPASLDAAMNAALAVDADSWAEYEARIHSLLALAADVEWAAASLPEFEVDPPRWFRLWLRGRRERDATEAILWRRLRALTLAAPGLSLEEALDATGQTLGELLAFPEPPATPRDQTGAGRAKKENHRDEQAKRLRARQRDPRSREQR
jgi:hypothetical protein